MFEPQHITEKELKSMGIKSVGKNVLISTNCTIYGLSNISIGDNVRIDSYCTIIATGELEIGSFVHIGAYSSLFAKYGIFIDDFCGLSLGVRIFTASDDYGGDFLTNPTVPEKYTSQDNIGKVVLKKHTNIGANSVILPNVTLYEGVAVGALSLVTMSLGEWSVYSGIPARKIRNRSKNLLKLKQNLYKEIK
jgi:galactoside O-acetyltransferase